MSTTGTGDANGSTGKPSKILGIDLGTTNSAMAVWDGTKPCIILTGENQSLVPSIVAISENGNALVGADARELAIAKPERTISSAKRFIGRKFRSVAAADRNSVAYQVVAGEEGETLFQVGMQQFRPEDIAAHVLRNMKA